MWIFLLLLAALMSILTLLFPPQPPTVPEAMGRYVLTMPIGRATLELETDGAKETPNGRRYEGNWSYIFQGDKPLAARGRWYEMTKEATHARLIEDDLQIVLRDFLLGFPESRSEPPTGTSAGNKAYLFERDGKTVRTCLSPDDNSRCFLLLRR